MIDPDYGTISDIDPDGGGDYTTLQAWYEDTWDEAAVQHARCHHSDSTDLGELDTSTHNWVYAPTAEQPVCIYAADGDEADGSKDDDLQGAAVLAEAASAACLAVEWEAVKVHGLRLTPSGNLGLGAKFVDCESVLIERSTIILDGASGGIGIGAQQATPGATTAATFRNNLILNTPSSTNATGILAVPASATAVINATIYGNSIVNCAHPTHGGVGAIVPIPGGVANMTTRNNVVVDDGVQAGDCFAEGGAGTVNWDMDYDVASDATATGSNAKTGVAIGDVWADIADPYGPFAPKVAGELDPPDGVNLYAAGVVEDSLGIERPSCGSHYRGGQEIFCGLYKAYGGQTPSTVDYATMLASVRAGAGEMDIAGLGLAAGGEYSLGVRVTSAAGIEETNTDRLTRAVVDEAGDLQPLPLAAVRELTAELQTDGRVIVGFTHTTSPGWATPTEFEVLTDNGTGELNLTTPAAIINVTDAGVGDYEAAVAASTLPAKFSARARNGSETGPVAPPVTVSLPAGPAAVEET